MTGWSIAAQWAGVGVALMALIISLYAATLSRRRADSRETDNRFARMRDDVTHLQQRAALTEERLGNTPRAAELQTIGGEIKTLVARLDGMVQLVERQEKVTNRLEDYVREVSKK